MRYALIVSFILFSTFTARAQMTCSSRPISPASVRAEGYTELLGDLTIACTGGTPTAAGTLVSSGDITVTLNVPVTNRKNAADNFIDALLLVDEPHSKANPSIPLTLCGASGVDCNITGTGTGASVYNGASNRPNVFQGELTGTSTVRFRLPVDPPGAAGQRIFRIVNLRGDATRKAGQSPNTITATATIPGGSTVSATIIGIVQPGMTLVPTNVRRLQLPPVELPGCKPLNTDWAANQEGDLAPAKERNYAISIQEGSIGAWKPRNIAQQLAAGRYGGSVSATLSDLNQNIAGFTYGTESGFYNGATADPGAPIPAIPSTTRFPAVRGMDRAGAADFGTRIPVRFSNVPAGVKFYLPVETPLVSNWARTGSAVMVQSDGQGGMQRVAGGARYGLAEMTASGSTATAFYEVVSSDPLLLENLSIPVVVVTSGVSGPAASAVKLTAGIVPWLGPAAADPSAVVPRFLESTVTEDAFVWTGSGCETVDLYIGTNATPSTPSIEFLVVNQGNQASSGAVTVTATLPAGLTATSWTAPSNWTCSLGSLTCTSASAQFPGGSGVTSFRLNYSVGSGLPAEPAIIGTVSGGSDGYTGNNTATYRLSTGGTRNPVAVATSPPGLVHAVDGTYYRGTVSIPATVGQTLQVNTISPQTLASGVQVNFESWSDAGPQSHSYTVPSTAAKLTAAFRTPQPAMECNYAVAGPPAVVRKEGLTELLMLSFTCTGGTPTPAGQSVPRSDVRVTLNAPVTSRIVSPGFLEALLVVDFPHTPLHPNVPVLPCGASGSNDNGSGECTTTGAGSATYNGTSGHPNAFQGRLEGVNTIVFKNVPIDPPGVGNYRYFQVLNARVNASSLPEFAQRFGDPGVGVKFSIDSPIVIDTNTDDSGVPTLATRAVTDPRDPLYGANYSLTAPLTLSRCSPANPEIYADSSKGLDTGGQNGSQTSIRFFEIASNAFLSKSWSVLQANQGAVTAVYYPADVRQDIPDANWLSETGFFGGSSLIPSVFPNSATGSTPPPPSPEFPSTRGLNLAGKADSGIRIFFRFTGVPADVKLFVPVRSDMTFGLRTGQIALLSVDGNGAGTFTQVAGNASGLAQVAVSSGEGVAYYEVLGGNPVSLDYIYLPVAVAFPATQAGGGGAIRVQVGLAPISVTGVPDSSSPIPRFARVGPEAGSILFATINSCGLNLDKSSLSFQTTVGVDPAQQSINVSNPGNPSFTWTASKNGSWINVSPTSGTGSATINVRPSAAGLAAGTYDGSVFVSSPGQVTQTVSVRMVVSGGTSTPNYAGSVDAKSCDAITGWAADRSRLNQSINVSLWAGNASVATMLASASRPDVGTYLGDNGLHGFTFSVPSGLRDGTQRTYSVRFESGSSIIGTTFNLTCGTTPPPPVGANNTGYFDYAGCDAMKGWAADLNRLNQAISVELVEGTTVLATVLANGSRSDVGAAIGDNGLHGFTIPTPDSLKTGSSRSVSIRYAGTTQALPGSPRTIQCGSTPPPSNPRYTGYFDSLSCDAASGWAADQNRLNQAISVELVEGTSVLATVLANTSRPDVGSVLGDNGLHGFTIPIPDSLKNGVQRTVLVRYAGTTQAIANSPKTLQCGTAPPPPTNPRYTGYIDNAGCQVVNGWAADLNRLNQAISVDLVEGSSVLATVLANTSRPDVGSFIGDNGLHGFSIPTPDALKNGTARTIQVRYSGTTQALSGSPRTITCAGSGTPVPSYAGYVDQVGCSTISGWAADRNRLNTSISVDILEGSTLLGTVLANGVRGDVGSYLGDNGAHAFNWVTPGALKDGRDHTITVRPAGSTTALGGAQNLRCPIP